MVYGLLCRTNIGHLLSSKAKDLFTKEDGDHFTKHLEEEVRNLGDKSDHEIQVELFLEITRLLKLRGTKYTLLKEIEDQCTNIVYEVYQQYKKQDKQFRAFTEKQAGSTMLQQVVQFQMSKVFSELDSSFHDFPIQDQTQFASQVNEYIQSLPEEKQVKIKEKLGINDLSDEMVHKTIATSGTSIVFAVIVEVSGFAFYTTATSLVASFAGLFGLTLPFGFYTGLTSTVAIIANPLFLVPMLLGGGYLLVNHQNNSLKSKLLPIIIMQIALPYMSSGADDISFDEFIQEWESRYQKDVAWRKELAEIVAEQKMTREQITDRENRIKEIKRTIYIEESLIDSEKQKIKSALKRTDFTGLDISSTFENHALQYRDNLDEIFSLKSGKKVNGTSTGFFQHIGNTVSNFSTSLDIKNKESEAEEMLSVMADDVLLSKSRFMQSEREKTQLSRMKIRELAGEKGAAQKEKKEFETALSRLNNEHNSFTQKIKTLEKENHGLADLFTRI